MNAFQKENAMNLELVGAATLLFGLACRGGMEIAMRIWSRMANDALARFEQTEPSESEIYAQWCSEQPYLKIAKVLYVIGLTSALEKYWDASQHIDALSQRIGTLKHQMSSIGNKVINIDLSNQEAALIENGTIIERYPVSTGAWETPTPTGKFQIHTMQSLRISNQDIPYRMPNYMAFTPNGSHGMHALPYLGEGPESSDYWEEALSHISIPVSHGCIRLLPEDAIALYEWAEVGTPVYINT